MRTRADDLSKRPAESTAQNESLERRLTALDTDLGEAKSRLTATEVRNVQLSHEVTQTRAAAAARALAEARTAAGSPETIAS